MRLCVPEQTAEIASVVVDSDRFLTREVAGIGMLVAAAMGGISDFELFTEGDDLYASMVAAIESAERNVRMESYIFAADEVGRRFADALAARARAGVDVRLHLDRHGADFPTFRGMRRELERAGVAFRWYHPWLWRHPLQYRRRNHRKLLVVDDRRAFLGGFNIRRLNSRALSGEGRQRDTHVGVTGPLVRTAVGLFDAVWDDKPLASPEDIPDDPAEIKTALLVPSYSRRCAWRLACLHAGIVSGAVRYAYVTSPYFGPGTVVESAMSGAAERGVDIRLLLPKRGDPAVVGWATRAAYHTLLASGVRIFEYQPRKLHAKSMVVDGGWAVVGSANLDHLSLFVNHELILVARAPRLAESLRLQYERDLELTREVMLPEWQDRGLGERVLEMIGRALRRVL